jgi:predicted lipoprotein with Yx(FWY)xxD motif
MHRQTHHPVIGPALVCGTAALLAACGSEGASSSTGAGTHATAASTPDISVGNASLGRVLTDRAGMTLYYFTPEMGSKLVCDTGTCVSTWPLVTVTGSPSAAPSLTGQLTTISAPSGQSEIVYNGWPLHTYSGDKSPGDTNGQGIAGKWFAATPSLTSSGSSGAGGATPSATGSYNPY